MRIVDQAAKPDVTALLALGDRIGRKPDRLGAFGDLLIQALTDRVRARARRGGANFRPWIEAWEKVRQTFIDAEALYLEPRQTIVSSVLAISEAAKRNAL